MLIRDKISSHICLSFEVSPSNDCCPISPNIFRSSEVKDVKLSLMQVTLKSIKGMSLTMADAKR